MFSPRKQPLLLVADRMLSLRVSLNTPVVSTPELPAGPARAAIAVHSEAGRPCFTVAVRSLRNGDSVLYELEGEAMWKKPQGPKNVSLERCDLGGGPGVVKGAYAGLPRYFADANRVMDLETRLLHCMMTLQGRSREEATKRVFGNADKPSEMEVLSAYVAGQSNGMPMRPGRDHPKEKAAYQLGQKLYFHRAGLPLSFTSAYFEAMSGLTTTGATVLTNLDALPPSINLWRATLVWIGGMGILVLSL